jgi:tRNA pseudouridine38-40 synthase
LRVAALIEYDGKDFSGWQVQPGERTVQSELEAALKTVLRKETPILGSGRTDTGVHALGMVAHFDIDEVIAIELPKLQHSVNGISAYDVVIKDMRIVPDDFHARFSAVSREYQYTVIHGKTSIYRDLAWQVWGELDIMAMQETAGALIGKWDFTSLSKQTDAVKDYFCFIMHSEWSIHKDTLIYSIKANRFVRGMVRAIVGSMTEVGKGRMSVDEFKSLLHKPKEFERAKFIAPPQGLILTRVEYPEVFGLW